MVSTTEMTGVRMVHIRALGDIDCSVSVDEVGTAHAVASLTVGTVLARIGGRKTAEQMVETWREAALHVAKLPASVSETWAGPDLGVSTIGVVVRFGGDVATRHDLLPPSKGLPTHHVRVQIGPVVWQVLDQAAHGSMVRAFERVHAALS